ncbi:MAG: hypothetical protein AB8B88_11505 [Devosiaceae bacterium]
MVERLATLFFERGDIGHVALFLWAASASALSLIQLRVLTNTAARFEAFVLAIARLNAMLSKDTEPTLLAASTQRVKKEPW